MAHQLLVEIIYLETLRIQVLIPPPQLGHLHPLMARGADHVR